jgi:molybdopterin adenylyltransferase
MAERRFSAAVVTVSDSAVGGEREDVSGPTAARLLEQTGFQVAAGCIVGDDLDAVRDLLIDLADRNGFDLIITTGGTGFGPRDVTPEATAAAVFRRADSLVEFMRFEACRVKPRAALSRGIAGIRGRTLIVNLPGSPAAVEESLNSLFKILHHALELLAGNRPH